MKMAHDLMNQRFGRLIVVERLPNSPTRHARWKCVCNCGNTHEAFAATLRRGAVKSCGCLTTRTHGKTDTKVYETWCRIKARCYNKNNPKYPDYGGRGIEVCARWLNSFENFYEDMGELSSKDHSIDRIDNDGDYEPGNCQWSTRREQGRNKRNNVWLEFKGKRQTVAEWSRETGISDFALYSRVRNNWTTEQVLTTPIGGAR